MNTGKAIRTVKQFDMNAQYEHAGRDDLMIEAQHNLDALQTILNSEDVLDSSIGFGLANFVGHTQNLLNLAESKG